MPGAAVEAGQIDAVIAELGAQAALETLVRSVIEISRIAPHLPSRISVRFGCASVEVQWPVAGGASHESVADPTVDHRDGVRSPLVGTFYRAPEPGAPPFVEVGDSVQAGQQVAVVEAMKLMNTIVADRAGRISEVLVDDGQPVEFDQLLFLLTPLEQE
ncbi:MAG: acetyl-CoA carboxylase biotin carboxyl carrier protein [Pseudonocardiaceae bacterium]